jgi:hypothetical protein
LKDPKLQQPGIVRYDDLAALPGHWKYRGLFGIWREAASDVGDAFDPDVGDGRIFALQLSAFREAAHEFLTTLRNRVSKTERWATVGRAQLRSATSGTYVTANPGGSLTWHHAPGDVVGKLAVDLAVCRLAAELMARGKEGPLVGAALRSLLHHDILLTDVHFGNLGRVTRGKKQRLLVITDPGLATPLTGRLARTRIDAS